MTMPLPILQNTPCAVLGDLPLVTYEHDLARTLWERIQADSNFLDPFLFKLPRYTLHYSVLRHWLLEQRQAGVNLDTPHYREQLENLLRLSILFKQIYRDYVPIGMNKARYWHEQQEYELLLYGEVRSTENLTGDYGINRFIRWINQEYNAPRLLVVRGRALLINLDLFYQGGQACGRYIGFLKAYTDTLFSYLAWMWFVPRLVIDVVCFFKHVIPCVWWMDEQERALNWRTRVEVQWTYRWRALSNDFPWLIAGLVACFYLSSGWSKLLTLVMQCYDLIMIGAVMPCLDEQRYAEIQQHDPNNQEFIERLNARIAYDRQRYPIHWQNFGTLVLAYALMLPTLPLYAVVIGGIAALVITYVAWDQYVHVERHRRHTYGFDFFPAHELVQRRAPVMMPPWPDDRLPPPR